MSGIFSKDIKYREGENVKFTAKIQEQNGKIVINQTEMGDFSGLSKEDFPFEAIRDHFFQEESPLFELAKLQPKAVGIVTEYFRRLVHKEARDNLPNLRFSNRSVWLSESASLPEPGKYTFPEVETKYDNPGWILTCLICDLKGKKPDRSKFFVEAEVKLPFGKQDEEQPVVEEEQKQEEQVEEQPVVEEEQKQEEKVEEQPVVEEEQKQEEQVEEQPVVEEEQKQEEQVEEQPVVEEEQVEEQPVVEEKSRRGTTGSY